jgi:metal-responsive CopG/Arc/MetJ family transcriptional regulator
MKTAISVPDEVFDQVETQTAELGISRSEFFTRAARQYLDKLEEASLTQQIDAAIDVAGADDSGSAAAAAGRAFLTAVDDEW